MGIFSSKTETKPVMLPGASDLSRRVLNNANRYFKSPESKNRAFTGQGYASLSDDTLNAMGGLTTLAGNNSGGRGMSGHLQGIMDRGGFNQGQVDTMDSMRDLTNNTFMNSLIDGNGLTDDQKLVADRYRTGMDEEFGTSDAYNTVRDNALARQRMELDATAAKSGRFGGGSSQTILAREQGNLGAGMDVAEMDKWRARTDKAAGDLAALSAAGVGQHGAAVDRKSGLESTLFNMNQAGLGNMAQAYNTAQQPYLTQRAVGLEREQQDQKRINDAMRIHAEQDPMNRYRDFLSLATGTPTGSTQTTDPSLLSLGLGGGLGILALGSMMNGWGGGGQAAAGSSGYGTGGW